MSLSPAFENGENLLYSTRFSHTMSTIYLAGLHKYTFRSKVVCFQRLVQVVHGYQTSPSHDLCLDPMLFSMLSEASSELHGLGQHVHNR